MPQFDWEHGGLAEGLACYRRREFFLAHEHWEGVWLGCAEPEKTFLQALIQIAAAFHHLTRGNRVGAASLLRRARRKLEPYPDEFGGVSLADVRESVRKRLCAIENGEGSTSAFSIHLLTSNGSCKVAIP
jgi:predicted metal-dependent hydrolase